MAISLVATIFLLPATPKPERKESITEPIKALRHRSLAITSVVGLLYNWAFFTLLGYSPFLMGLSPLKLGAVFFGWGVLVAVFAVFAAPRLKDVLGTPNTLYVNFIGLAAVLAIIGIWPDHRGIVITAVIVAGAFIGINNTLVTTAVMSIAPSSAQSPRPPTDSCGSSAAGSPRSWPPSWSSTSTCTCRSCSAPAPPCSADWCSPRCTGTSTRLTAASWPSPSSTSWTPSSGSSSPASRPAWARRMIADQQRIPHAITCGIHC